MKLMTQFIAAYGQRHGRDRRIIIVRFAPLSRRAANVPLFVCFLGPCAEDSIVSPGAHVAS